ncbi:MAG TPA: UDP-3-O-(3-hydroxymyristoyl)glucosamine N-acyltransferase [Gallionellaceae bacterium]|nr:UDP-3-O-(3-hydroxymyristoyl)glucosamine N-acyltransferase [Gallionellaceae bacterium]
MSHTAYRLEDIVARFGGRVLGNAGVLISQIATLDSAKADQIAFLSNSKYRAQLEGTHAGAVILAAADADATLIPRIVCDNPYAYFAKLSAFLNPLPSAIAGIHPSAVIGEGAAIASSAQIDANVVIGDGAKIGARSVIMAGCYIGAGVVIGENSRLYPRVVVYHDCVLGNNLIAHSGVVIGADGFGFAMEEERWLKIPQIGRVVIGNDVEIGANTTIDRGALADTVIEDDVKLDNQIQIAHNVRIGAHTAIAGCVGIAGSATIGRYCRIGGSAGILGHLQIADYVEISSFTLVGKSIKERGSYCGIFPFSTTQTWRKNAAQLRHLDGLADRIKQLELQIESLKN